MKTNSYTAIMGMGKTGVACIRFLTQRSKSVCIMDESDAPSGSTILKKEFPHIQCITGKFDAEILANASEIVISPGVPIQTPALAQAQSKNIPIISEIELFAREVNAPVVAITGSNGKSTVTTLLGEMAEKSGLRVQVGGNLGTPALDLLCTPAPDLYVLELSSFQLETTYSLNPKAAVVLNLSQDHLDRYANFADYVQAKQRVYQGDGVMIINAEDSGVVAMSQMNRRHISFGLKNGDFRILEYQGEWHLARGNLPLLSVKKLKIQGKIMWANALAALALGEAVELPLDKMLIAMENFKGLPHRCAWVARVDGVDWFDDSKGTNVGATIAAIQGLEKPKKIILIAGGEGKGMDFSPLATVAKQALKACVLIGRDAPIIEKALNNVVPIHYANSMMDAVEKSAFLADSDDAVLLSPACASFDMFKSYVHRGQVFSKCINHLQDNRVS